MRVLRVLLALVIPALFASVSQAQAPNSQGAINGQGHNAAHCAARAALHPGEPINKCDPPPTPTPPPPASSCASTGALALGPASITGKVTNSLTFAPLANWCVEVFGTLSATMPTDALGNYSFSGLPPGMYSVCIEVQSGWTLDFPGAGAACPGGTVYTFSLDAVNGYSAGFVNFRLH
ncbi:MAG TPA: carboxypeptidase regulatory-like domain-containing protein [Gemmatimonadales bacterium]|nr:carboxypeptidase regulatory-like domain-containing protein [Gemmatimonadales bacterium]